MVVIGESTFTFGSGAHTTTEVYNGQTITIEPNGVGFKTTTFTGTSATHTSGALEIGPKIGVIPMAEMWGHSKPLHRLGDVAFVALECGHPKACVLADVFHLYKSGSDFKGIPLLSTDALPHLHLNDYPATPPRAEITDAARVFIPAMAWHRSRSCCAIYGILAFIACCRWSCSTAITGSRMRSRSRRRGWRK